MAGSIPNTGELDWYTKYTKRHGDEGAEAWLVTMQTFSKSWDMREMHPHGSEVVLCTAGSIELYQELADGQVETVTLGPAEYAIIESGTLHTADVEAIATALFVTAVLDTQHRPR